MRKVSQANLKTKEATINHLNKYIELYGIFEGKKDTNDI